VETVLLITAAVVVVIAGILIKRADNERDYLNEGFIPPSWEAANQRDHPGGPAPVSETL
jgi:hypothetical protein